MYFLYSIIYFAVLLFLLPLEYLKRPAQLRKRWIKERFGKYSAEVLKSRCTEVKTSELPNPELRTNKVWIHAVSVGEVIAAVPLIKKLKGKYPSVEIIISTVTDTGQKVARERISSIARIIYMPFDLPFAIKNAIAFVSPSLFIIMETELWPNIIRLLKRNDVPVLLMNGRISEKSFRGYKRLRFFIKGALKNMDTLCMQNELYAERIKTLGAEPERVKAIGSFKFDTIPSSSLPEWTNSLRLSQESKVKSQEFTIIAGSTHRAEEDLILRAYIKLRKDFPKLNLIIAPRHPERFREVEDLLKKKGLDYIKRSELTHSSENTSIRHEPSAESHHLSGVIILLDVIGELSSVYGTCDIAIIGGSFIKHGGQNPLEPAYWGNAIVCGPHMENFPFIEEFYRGGGALKTDAANLTSTLAGLLSSPEKQEAMGKSAQKLYEKNSGAVERAIRIIEGYL